MNFAPIVDAPLVLKLHLAAAVPALLLGPVALWRQRRDWLHKSVGYAWMTAMLALALTGAVLPSENLAIVGPFGPIHLLVIVTLWGLYDGLRHARARRIEAHRSTMRWLWTGAVVVAGAFTLAPGRRLNEVFFPETPMAGLWVITAVLGWLLVRGVLRGVRGVRGARRGRSGVARG